MWPGTCKCNVFLIPIMLTSYYIMFSKKTCWLYVACVTLFYTHLQQDDKNPTVYFQMNQRSHKFKVLIPKNYINKASFYISFAITPAFVVPHWYPINHRDSPTVTCLWGLRWRLRDKHSSEEARIKYPAVSHPETSDMSMVYSFSFIIWITASKMQDRRPAFFIFMLRRPVQALDLHWHLAA